MRQFVVPQFLDVESKIIGPVSGRQFVIMLVSAGLSFVWFELFVLAQVWIPLLLLTMALGGVLAFAQVNGQKMHYFLLNIFETARRPRLKVWSRSAYRQLHEEIHQIKNQRAVKKPVNTSHLAALALMVDTGGVYQGEEQLEQLRSKAALVLPPSEREQQIQQRAEEAQEQRRTQRPGDLPAEYTIDFGKKR